MQDARVRQERLAQTAPRNAEPLDSYATADAQDIDEASSAGAWPAWVSQCLWGATGFLAGAIFWHAVGFWGFVSDVVLHSRLTESARYVEQTGPECTEMVLDRATGHAVPQRCPMDAELLNEGVLADKGDFLGVRNPSVARLPGALRLSDRSK